MRPVFPFVGAFAVAFGFGVAFALPTKARLPINRAMEPHLLVPPAIYSIPVLQEP
jgi:hypothetical protein